MDVSVITVTYNSEAFIGRQLAAMREGCRGLQFEQIVVDNASRDGSAAAARAVPGVTVLASEKNLGFAGGNNLGVQQATGDFLLFANPDIAPEPESVTRLVAYMRANPQVGICSGYLVTEQGEAHPEAQPRRFPTVWNQAALLLKLHFLFPRLLDTYLMRGTDFSVTQQVDSVRGSFILMRRELFTAMGFAFDPRYFIWFEDVDVCREAYAHGYTVMHVAEARCVDFVGRSFAGRESLWKAQNFTLSMLTYFRKWHAGWQSFLISCLRPLSIGLVWLRSKLIG